METLKKAVRIAVPFHRNDRVLPIESATCRTSICETLNISLVLLVSILTVHRLGRSSTTSLMVRKYKVLLVGVNLNALTTINWL